MNIGELKKLLDVLKHASSTRNGQVGLAASAAVIIGAISYLNSKNKDSVVKKSSLNGVVQKKGATKRIGVNRQFYAQIKWLLPICIPSIFCRESALLVLLALVLIIRSWLDIWFSSFNGVVVRSIVARDKETFIRNIIYIFGLMMWPMSIVNNSLKWTIQTLSICFRERLTKYAHEKYLKGIAFYRLSNLDNRVQNPDQLVTQDIERFSDSLGHLYSDIAKPIVDIFLFAYKLGEAIGLDAPIYMIGYFVSSAAFLKFISPPFGKYTAEEQKLEGEFRFAHSRIITHSEEIAFYRGAETEKKNANSYFERIVKHARMVYDYRFLNGIIDSIMVKYLATMLAYNVLARPVFDPSRSSELMGGNSNDPTKIMEDYSRNSSYLVNLSQAIGRLILAGRDLTKFAGFTSRVAEFLETVDQVSRGMYERTMISKNNKNEDGTSNALDQQQRVELIDCNKLDGKVSECSPDEKVIEFEQVSIVTPNGDVLVKDLSFKVESGMNCMITGPNGCGKSSLFRILGSLWPLFQGNVTLPPIEKMFYVPQRPYLALGTLRDQVIYPDDWSIVSKRTQDPVTDDKIRELLGLVGLEYLEGREGGFDSVQDWADVLSGGEKQRVAMARLFYHRPIFAILDECTSAVSIDIEGKMYTHARECGITLFTVSHRSSLIQYHEYILKFDGRGGYEFLKILKHPISNSKLNVNSDKVENKNSDESKTDSANQEEIKNMASALAETAITAAVASVLEGSASDIRPSMDYSAPDPIYTNLHSTTESASSNINSPDSPIASSNIRSRGDESNQPNVTRISSKVLNEIPLQPVFGMYRGGDKRQAGKKNEEGPNARIENEDYEDDELFQDSVSAFNSRGNIRAVEVEQTTIARSESSDSSIIDD